MDEIGSGMTDSQPLVNIKKGISKLKVSKLVIVHLKSHFFKIHRLTLSKWI
jgi:hypothetical protein